VFQFTRRRNSDLEAQSTQPSAAIAYSAPVLSQTPLSLLLPPVCLLLCHCFLVQCVCVFLWLEYTFGLNHRLIHTHTQTHYSLHTTTTHCIFLALSLLSHNRLISLGRVRVPGLERCARRGPPGRRGPQDSDGAPPLFSFHGYLKLRRSAEPGGRSSN
jgi:hypothetical protein